MMKIITCGAKLFVAARAAKTPITSDIWQRVLLLALVSQLFSTAAAIAMESCLKTVAVRSLLELL
jgi:hypothetical protein